jgi:hypothetical protein
LRGTSFGRALTRAARFPPRAAPSAPRLRQLRAKFKAFAEFGSTAAPGAASASSASSPPVRPASPAAARAASPAPGSPAAARASSAPAETRMDSVHFAKLCRDCGLVDNKKLLLGQLDLIFKAAAPGGGRWLDYASFLAALAAVAKALGVPEKHVQLWVCGSAPLEKAAGAEAVAASRPKGDAGGADPDMQIKPRTTANKLFSRRG